MTDQSLLSDPEDEQAIDTEAETERLEPSPLKRRKRQIVLNRAPRRSRRGGREITCLAGPPTLLTTRAMGVQFCRCLPLCRSFSLIRFSYLHHATNVTGSDSELSQIQDDIVDGNESKVMNGFIA